MNKYLGNYLLTERIDIRINDSLSLVSANSVKGLLNVIKIMQKGNFLPEIDNIDFDVDGISWQFHKPLDEVIKTFRGCCASSSQLVNYYLGKFYQDIGYFCFFNEDGNGHITSYVHENGYYYFIDSIMLRKDSIPFFRKESSNLDLFSCGDFTGYVFKSKSFEDYISFYIEQKKVRNLPAPFCFYTRKKCTATGDFTLPQEDEIKILYLDQTKHIRVKVANIPSSISYINLKN